jgi:hypothetical protein
MGETSQHINMLVHNVSHADFLLSVASTDTTSTGDSTPSTPFIKPSFSCFHETAVAVETQLKHGDSKDIVIMCPVVEVPELEFPIGFSLGRKSILLLRLATISAHLVLPNYTIPGLCREWYRCWPLGKL